MISELQGKLNEKSGEINRWLNSRIKGIKTPVYSSYDIRDNGIKAAIVDSNLFPSGWNNLDADSRKSAAEEFRKRLSLLPKDILIIPESHTRNTFYLSSLRTLSEVLRSSGFSVTIGTLREDIPDSAEVTDSDGHTIILEKMSRKGSKLVTKSFSGGLILLNNDFSTPAPKLLDGISDQIMPPLKLSWTHRKKMNHFRHYCNLTEEVSKLLGVDQWLLCPITTEVSGIDFKERINISLIAKEVDDLIARLKKKHSQYSIGYDPYVFVKDNSGTYGMGIITARSGSDILSLNTKGRQKMHAGKDRSRISSVIIQEGIATKYKVDGSPAEPVLYAVGGKVIGAFMRIHSEKDDKSSLNAPGVKFDTILHSHMACPFEKCVGARHDKPLYELLADIACIAIGMEEQE